MKGPVMPGKQFFLQAFGRDAVEFKSIMSMPEEFIRNRLLPNWKDLDSIESRWQPYVREWMTAFSRLSYENKGILTNMIASGNNELIKERYSESTGAVKKMLEFYVEENNIVTTRKP